MAKSDENAKIKLDWLSNSEYSPADAQFIATWKFMLFPYASKSDKLSFLAIVLQSQQIINSDRCFSEKVLKNID